MYIDACSPVRARDTMRFPPPPTHNRLRTLQRSRAQRHCRRHTVHVIGDELVPAGRGVSKWLLLQHL
jgi:hypothetical protein